MSLVAKVRGAGPSGFGYGSTAEEVARGIELNGRRFLLTGCNSGLGQETLRVLCQHGAQVIAAARTLDKARDACAPYGDRAVPIACELSEPESVLECARQVREQHGLLGAIVCNAGIMALPKLTVKHGLELQFLTNHMGHFLLVTQLLDRLESDGRVVVVSSSAHRNAPRSEGIQFDNLDGASGYSAWEAYGQSKLANLLFAKQLAPRLSSQQTANSLHPGVIATNLSRHMNPLVGLGLKLAKPVALKSIPEGTATQVFAAIHPQAAGLRGEYLSHCNVARPSRHGRDPALAARLWQKSEELARPWIG